MDGGGTSARTCLAIVLAAGEGTRMLSSQPKVLHQIAGRSLLWHVLASVREAAGMRSAVVIGPGHDAVTAEAKSVLRDAEIFVQHERRGTAHAVLMAKPAIAQGFDDILIAFGDTPLIRPQTFSRLRTALAAGASVVVLGFRAADPTGYGRLITQGDDLIAIREHADASDAERTITLCNAGLMAMAGKDALTILEQIGNDNRKGEFYLTDAVEIARRMGRRAVAIEAMEDEVSGINSKAQLAAAEGQIQQQLRQKALQAGVTLVAPETVFLAADTKLGREVVI